MYVIQVDLVGFLVANSVGAGTTYYIDQHTSYSHKSGCRSIVDHSKLDRTQQVAVAQVGSMRTECTNIRCCQQARMTLGQLVAWG